MILPCQWDTWDLERNVGSECEEKGREYGVGDGRIEG